MPSMKYADRCHEFVVFTAMQDIFGLFSSQPPMVFNSYTTDHALPEPETEPEPEPGVAGDSGTRGNGMNMAKPKTTVALEILTFTKPYLIGHLDGMCFLIKNGENDGCDSGLSLGIDARQYDRKRDPHRDMHLQGYLRILDSETSITSSEAEGRLEPVRNELLRVAGTPEAMKRALLKFQLLDILLTGQRLTKGNNNVLARKYLEENTEERKMKQAVHLIAVAPVFDTLGASRPHAGVRLTPVAT